MALEINPKSRQKDLVIQELEDEVLIYDLRTNKAFCLNHAAAFVWQHADGETTVKQIAYLLQKKLRTPVDESVVWIALERLEKDGLLENKPPLPPIFTGMSRRELIRTLGKSAAVALPLVMIITAPMAANAVSCRANGVACTMGSQCCSGTCNGTCISPTPPPPPSPGGGCVLWDTEIMTANGLSVRARDVAVGHSLLGVNCMNGETIAGRVKQVMELETSGVYSIFAENGAVVNCSPTHPLINGFGDSNGKHAKDFKEGDALLVFDRASQKIVEAKTVAINRVELYQPVIIFEMDTAEHTFVSGGIISHNSTAPPGK